MKKLTIIGLSMVIVIVCILLYLRHAKISRDRDFSQKLAGAWSWEYANIRDTYTFAPDGSFAVHEIFSHPKSTNTYQMAGLWHIKDGMIVQTVTNDSNTKRRVPRTSSGQVVRVDAHEYVVAFGTNQLVLYRATP
jgi:hypothetical protein